MQLLAQNFVLKFGKLIFLAGRNGGNACAVNPRRSMNVGGYNSCQWEVFKKIIGWERFRGSSHMHREKNVQL